MDKRLQLIFAGCAVAMLVILVWRASLGLWPPLFWGMLAVSAVCGLLVFVRFDHIFDYGYGLSAVLNSGLIIALQPSTNTVLAGGALALYGARMVLFTWLRQRSASFANRLGRIREGDARTPLPVKISIWLMCSLLLTYLAIPVAFSAATSELHLGIGAGVVVMLAGLFLETLADQQKQRAKAAAPDELVRSGLYRFWRHPNYSGEIIFQAGLILVGVSAAQGWVPLLMVLLAPGYIIVLMVFEARRVDAEQAERYAQQGYSNYRAISSSLLPRV